MRLARSKTSPSLGTMQSTSAPACLRPRDHHKLSISSNKNTVLDSGGKMGLGSPPVRTRFMWNCCPCSLGVDFVHRAITTTCRVRICCAAGRDAPGASLRERKAGAWGSGRHRSRLSQFRPDSHSPDRLASIRAEVHSMIALRPMRGSPPDAAMRATVANGSSTGSIPAHDDCTHRTFHAHRPRVHRNLRREPPLEMIMLNSNKLFGGLC